jgi:peptidyl-prolyl cis-trans isomerase B (cyclophilin B)
MTLRHFGTRRIKFMRNGSAVKTTLVLLILALFSINAAWAEDLFPRVKIQTNKGDIILELNAQKAPNTVKNFVNYVQNGFYDGLIFHRVISNFMIQGGGFDSQFRRRPTNAPIQNEANNGLKNSRGTIAMARTQDPHSATGQFFINVVDNQFLDFRAQTMRGWGYAVFGKVIEGMDVVDTIRRMRTGSGGPFPTDVPQETVIMEKVSMLPANK